MAGVKKKSKTKMKCQDCISWENEPAWGHELCSYHRDCSGKDEWEPENCSSCKKQKIELDKLSEKDQSEFFKEMYEMLEDTKQNKLQTVKVDWEYSEILGIFLGNFEIPHFSSKNTNSNNESQNNIEHLNIGQEQGFNQNEPRVYATEYDDPYNEEGNSDSYGQDNDFVMNNYDDSMENNENFIENGGNGQMPSHYNNMNDPHYNMQHNNLNPQMFPPSHSFPLYDIQGRNNLYNVPNNQNLYGGPQHYPMPGISANMYPFTPPYYQPPNFGGQPVVYSEVDSNTGETWLYFNPMYHTKKGNDKIEMWFPSGSRVVDVRYRIGNPNMFKTITPTAAKNPTAFIDGREGHSILLSTFNRSISGNDFGTTKRIPFETRLESGSGLASTLDIIKKCETEMSEAIFDNKLSELHKCFPKSAFDAVSLADFTSGWNLTSSSFVAFAKDEDLDISKLNKQLNINVNFQGFKNLLTIERDTRRRMINSFTPLHFLDLLGDKLDSVDENVKRTTHLSSAQPKAIARTILPNLKNDIISWKTAKMNLRKAVLKDHNHSNNLRLLRSTLWDENLFSKSVTDEVKERPSRNMANFLGLGATSSSNNNFNSGYQRKYQVNANNNKPYNYRNRVQNQIQPFRFKNQGAQKQQNFTRAGNRLQEKTTAVGNYTTPEVTNQTQNNRGQGQSPRGRRPFTRHTPANKKNVRNK